MSKDLYKINNSKTEFKDTYVKSSNVISSNLDIGQVANTVGNCVNLDNSSHVDDMHEFIHSDLHLEHKQLEASMTNINPEISVNDFNYYNITYKLDENSKRVKYLEDAMNDIHTQIDRLTNRYFAGKSVKSSMDDMFMPKMFSDKALEIKFEQI